MSRLLAYNCYCLFIALKNHFTQESYDFFKYAGKTSISKEAFLSRQDRYKFQKLCRVCEEHEMTDFLVSNFTKGRKWVGEFLDEEAKIVYQEYVNRKQNLCDIFANDLQNLFGKNNTQIFKAKGGEYPHIIYAYMQGEITLETFSILDQYIEFSKKYNDVYGKDDVLWGKIRLLSKKFIPFLHYDKMKIKNILKEKLHEHDFTGSRERQKAGNSAITQIQNDAQG